MKKIRLGILMWMLSCILPPLILGIFMYVELKNAEGFNRTIYLIPVIMLFGLIYAFLFSIIPAIVTYIIAKKGYTSIKSLIQLNVGLVIYSLISIHFTTGFQFDDALLYPSLLSFLFIISANVFLWMQDS